MSERDRLGCKEIAEGNTESWELWNQWELLAEGNPEKEQKTRYADREWQERVGVFKSENCNSITDLRLLDKVGV